MKKPQKHLEINSYELKGITIRVKINYDNGHIALVDDKNWDKKWRFNSRGLEYMKGWQNILDAMKYAVAEATKLLEEDLAEKSKLTEHNISRAIKSLDELNIMAGIKLGKW